MLFFVFQYPTKNVHRATFFLDWIVFLQFLTGNIAITVLDVLENCKYSMQRCLRVHLWQ